MIGMIDRVYSTVAGFKLTFNDVDECGFEINFDLQEFCLQIV